VNGFTAWEAFKFILCLAVVGGLAVMTTRFLGRRYLVSSRNGSRLKLEETLSLGPNRMVCLAGVDDEVLVLGVTERAITLLTTLGRRDDGGSDEAGRASADAAGSPEATARGRAETLGRAGWSSAAIGLAGGALRLGRAAQGLRVGMSRSDADRTTRVDRRRKDSVESSRRAANDDGLFDLRLQIERLKHWDKRWKGASA